MAISRSIVDAVRSMKPPGRFLDKDPHSGLWNDIGDRKAIEKTSQALRDGAADLRKQLSQDLGDPDFLNAVFEAGASNTSNPTTNSASSPKEKTKPVKAKAPVKKGHRRTTSNPNTLAEKKKAAVAKRQMKSELSEEELQRPVLTPLTSYGSMAPSPMSERPTFGRASSFDYTMSAPYPAHTLRSPGAPPYPHRHSSGPSLKSASFDTAVWQYGRSRASLSPGRPPLSPPACYSRPPISPVQHPGWSPGAYARCSPFRSWRTSPSPYHAPYGHSDLAVPHLGRKASDSSMPRVPLSPVRPTSAGARENSYRPPLIMRASSAEDFEPPTSPGSFHKPRNQKVLVASPTNRSADSMEIDKDDDEKYQSSHCSIFGNGLFGGCFMMECGEKTDVEVVLSKNMKETTIEVNPADDHSQKSLSPLPFLRNESETSTSFFETLLQLPIAPCSPQDVE